MLFLGVTGFTLSPKGGSIEVPVNQTLSGVVAKTGRTLIETEPRKRPEYAHSAWRRLGIRTFVCLPLKTDQGVIGALSLAHSRKVEVSEALCRWAATLANYTAALMEHRRVEEAVRQSEARYRTLVETSPDGILVLDLNATIKMANQQAAALTGYTSPQELAGKRVSDLISPTQGPQLFETIEQTVAAGVMRNLQVTVLRKDGTPLPVEINASLIKDSQNQPLGIVAVVRDITARQQAEESLRRATRALKTLNECNQALVRATDEAAFLQDVCRIIVEVGGYHLAWVGFAQDDAAKTVLPVAYVGSEGEGPDWIKITWGDDDRGQGPGGKAIRTGRPAMAKNILMDPYFAPWRDEALNRGYASSLSLPLKSEARILGALNIYAQEPDAFDAEEVQLLEELAGEVAYGIEALRTRAAHLKAEAQLHESFAKLQRTLQGTVLALSSAVERWDPYTAGHQKRVAILASAIAREMGLSRDLVQGLCVAGMVHDIGKIGIPAEILSKPRRLTNLEFALIKTHPLAASEILQAAEFPWPLADIILKHHERLDGSGYPAGLKGGQIPLEARILAVADVVEAMVSHRPHRPGFSLDQALEEVSQKRGLLYDPQVVEACIKLFKEKGFNFDSGPPHFPTMMEERKQAAL
jgi:PAS domain S-box-containing protein